MSRTDDVRLALHQHPRTFVVTGAAGFIGSHLVETLLSWSQKVVAIDNFATGKRENIAPFLQDPGFRFVEADINDTAALDGIMPGADAVLHQAALGSVPRSIRFPEQTHAANVTGFLSVLDGARRAGVKRFVYASSSSVYGDHADLPKLESNIGNPLSPYAATKRMNEIYADVWQRTYGMECVGLRYFNVFGPRQDRDGAYAAVIPIWVKNLMAGTPCVINGDGQTSRDFCYVKNAVQANLLAATAPSSSLPRALTLNVACGQRTDLVTLHQALARRLGVTATPVFGPERPGDVRHSLANIDEARQAIGYAPTHDVDAGLDEAIAWYASH